MPKVDKLLASSWVDNICLLIHKQCQYKAYHSDIKDHLTLNTMFRVSLRATSHMELRAHDHYTSSTFIGGKVEPLHVRFTLHSRDHRSMWIWDGCKVYMDSCMASNGSCFMVTWITFKSHLLEVVITKRPLDSKHPQPLVYYILTNVRAHMNINSLKYHLVEGLVTYGFTLHLRVRDHIT